MLSMLSCLVGCATTADGCAGTRAIRPSASDVAAMSVETKREIVEHNLWGAQHCGWKP